MPDNAAMKWMASTLEWHSGHCQHKFTLRCQCAMVARSSSSPAWELAKAPSGIRTDLRSDIMKLPRRHNKNESIVSTGMVIV